MSLIVESGMGLTDSESYVSVSYADSYCASHGLTAWTGTDAVKEVALRKATQYLDSMYDFKSERISYTQALAFPRVLWNWDYPEMNRLRNACCELAVKALTGALFSDVEPQQVISVKVGPIERTTKPANNGGQKRFAQVDAMIACLTKGMGSVSVARA